MPPPLADRHVQLFTEHGISAKPETAAAAKTKAAPEGTIQGWLCRNGTLAVRDGALIITPDAKAAVNARPFITNSPLDIPGPVTATLRLRAKQGGKSAITWRTKTASLTPEQTAVFDWPASAEWQEVKVELPEKSRIIHIRISPARAASGLEIQSIGLRGKDGKAQTWQFNKPQP